MSTASLADMPDPLTVADAKNLLTDGRDALADLHAKGTSGTEISRRMTELRDRVVIGLWDAAVAELSEKTGVPLSERTALVAHAGYGRKDVAPYSDVDLMLLRASGDAEAAGVLAERLLRDIFDAGLVLGHSTRTVEEAVRLGIDDATIGTSLMEARFLAGNRTHFGRFAQSFSNRLARRSDAIVAKIIANRDEERVRYGATVYLLEPNVKRTVGGLRDIQLLRWLGRTVFDRGEPEDLTAIDQLTEEDVRAVGAASDFLLRVRNELHFHAGRAADVLCRAEQLRIADAFGYPETKGMRRVEYFMREYFRHTQAVANIVARFTERALQRRRWGRAIEMVVGHKSGEEYHVGPKYIRATRVGLPRLRKSLLAVLQLADLSCLYNKRIAPQTWEAIRRRIDALAESVTAEVRIRFVTLLGRTSRLAEVLRELHSVGLLERLVPAMEHARGLLQFNQYHKYTVDEHCLLSVEKATELLHAEDELGETYRDLKRKHLLHLALLLHDLGKGFEDDHVQVGVRIAQDVSESLGLTPEERDIVVFLVRNHMTMTDLALRRDVEDEALVLRFAVECGSPERLRMLYLSSVCDLAAVGPDTLTDWKKEMLGALYRGAAAHLVGPRERTKMVGREDEESAVEETELAARAAVEQVAVEGTYLAENQTVLFTVATQESLTRGVFHKITGALARKGCQILDAEIDTSDKGAILDRYRVIDPDYADGPPPERIDEISAAIRTALLSDSDDRPRFRRTWQITENGEPARPGRVEVDNGTSRDCTILDIFAFDRPGLLYDVARALFDLDLDVRRAKIATYHDQVVDVFYVTDAEGQKITAPFRLAEIRSRVGMFLEGEREG